MPTVLRLDGLRVRIYVDDHRPAHIHVIAADGEAVFVLNCPDGPPELRERLLIFNKIQPRALLSAIASDFPDYLP